MLNPYYPTWGKELIEISLWERLCRHWLAEYDRLPREIRDQIKEKGG